MSDIRERAAKAARDYDAIHMNHFPEMPHYARVMFIEGYCTGHAAGFDDGARAFAEYMIAKFPRLEARSKPYRDELARFLASRTESKGETP